MEPVRVDPFTGLLKFLASGMRGPFDVLENVQVHGQVISTTLPSDTNIWETGIFRGEGNDRLCIIVEQYPDKSHAEIGQKKWAKMIEEMPDLPIKDIDTWSLEEAK